MKEKEWVSVIAVSWALVWGLLLFVPLVALAWAFKYRLRWQLTALFVGYLIALAVLLFGLRP